MTGPNASGKTTASRMFSAMGAAVIGVTIVPDRLQSRIERQRPDARGRSHPHPLSPLADLRGLRRILDGEATDVPYLILDIPSVLDTGLPWQVDRLLWVDIDKAVQIDRLKASDGIGEDQARRIQQSWPASVAGLALADDVIENSSSREALRSQVIELHHVYRRLAAQFRLRNAIYPFPPHVSDSVVRIGRGI